MPEAKPETQAAYLDKKKLAKLLDVSERTVNEFMKQGLPHFRVGNKILRFNRIESEQWFENRFRVNSNRVDDLVNEILG